LGMSPMIVFTGHTEKIGHFLQPIAIAIGQRVISITLEIGWRGIGSPV
jgi:hypothetical protein